MTITNLDLYIIVIFFVTYDKSERNRLADYVPESERNLIPHSSFKYFFSNQKIISEHDGFSDRHEDRRASYLLTLPVNTCTHYSLEY